MLIFAAREVKEGILFECKWYYDREAVLFSSLLFSLLPIHPSNGSKKCMAVSSLHK
jgi:hypothetical protein